jgi:hypothetical protein
MTAGSRAGQNAEQFGEITFFFSPGHLQQIG